MSSKTERDREINREAERHRQSTVSRGGVRVWVYRIMCNAGEDPVQTSPEVLTTQTPSTTTAAEEFEVEESNDGETEEEETAEQQDEAPEEKPAFNPLRYRPPSVQRASTGVHRH